MNRKGIFKDGKLTFEPLTDEELAAMQPSIVWHNELKNARVCFTVDQYNANMQRLFAHNLGLENHPFLAALASAVQSGSFIRVEADGMVYYYCEYVEEVDEAIIIDYGGFVEPKP